MLKLRRPDVCVACGCELPVGSRAWWDAVARTVTCASCRESSRTSSAAGARPLLDRGRPGASAAREYQRRRRNREARTREAHPRTAGLRLALRGAPQHETAFRSGERGEKRVAAFLERRTAAGPSLILHDRRVPGGHGNIDHLAIAPSGVFVIDAKNIKGRVRVTSPLFGAAKLMIAGRNRTKLVAGLDRQVAAVRHALAGCGNSDVTVHGVLCFTKAELPVLGTNAIGGYRLRGRRSLARRLRARGPLDALAIDTLARALADALPPA
jgi:Nuclease-related domain